MAAEIKEICNNTPSSNNCDRKKYEASQELVFQKMLKELGENLNNPSYKLEDLFNDTELYNFFINNFHKKENGEHVISSKIIENFKLKIKNFLKKNYPDLKIRDNFTIDLNQDKQFQINGSNFISGLERTLEDLLIKNVDGKVVIKKIPNSFNSSLILTDMKEIDESLTTLIINKSDIKSIEINCLEILKISPSYLGKVIEFLNKKIEIEKGNSTFQRELEILRMKIWERFKLVPQ